MPSFFRSRPRHWARPLFLFVALIMSPLLWSHSVAAAPAPAGPTIYGDALAPGWSNWSWDTLVNPSATSPVYGGSRSLVATITKPWGGLYLHAGTALDSTPYTSLQFVAQASGSGGRFGVRLLTSNDRQLGKEVYLASAGGDPVVGVWRVYSIPLSAFTLPSRLIGGVVIQDESGRAQPALFVDELGFAGAGAIPPPTASPSPTPQPLLTPTLTPRPSTTPSPSATPTPTLIPPSGTYPWHTGIVSTTFWVGEIFDPALPDGSQVCSTYDSQWAFHWSGVNSGVVLSTAAGCPGSTVGGCDGVPGAGSCATERRTAANGYFPTRVTPRENPFYLDLSYDDLNDPIAFQERCVVIPWANAPAYAGHCADQRFSYMKNRWVKIVGPNGQTCYGQIEDAGPSHGTLYHDKAYVFGVTDARPVQGNFNNAGMDVSPALNGCLGFAELDGQNDLVRWQFVDASAVPTGPWTQIITTSGVS